MNEIQKRKLIEFYQKKTWFLKKISKTEPMSQMNKENQRKDASTKIRNEVATLIPT